tara:strand:- start:57 stop:437 length:381 start_codon:yes stop_codon:yes gene_type:complete
MSQYAVVPTVTQVNAGIHTLLDFNRQAGSIARGEEGPRIILSIHIAGRCLSVAEGGVHYFHAVQCCLFGVFERGSRFTAKANGVLSFSIDATEWDLGIAVVHLLPIKTDNGVFSVLVAFINHSGPA